MIDTIVDCKGAKAMSDGFQSHQVDTHLQYLEIFRGKMDFIFSEMRSAINGMHMSLYNLPSPNYNPRS